MTDEHAIKLCRLLDAIEDNILTDSDAAIIAEVLVDGEDPDNIAQACRALLDDAFARASGSNSVRSRLGMD